MSFLDFLDDLGRQVKVEREINGFSTEKFAQLCGVHKGTISKIENGKMTISTKLLFRICEVLSRDLLFGHNPRFVDRSHKVGRAKRSAN